MTSGLYEPADRRFWRFVRRTETCWLWTGSLGNTSYGRFNAGGPPGGKPRHVFAHRYAYERLRGPIPDGLVLDHLCGVHTCVNPEHLEPVTLMENSRRGRRRHPTALLHSDTDDLTLFCYPVQVYREHLMSDTPTEPDEVEPEEDEVPPAEADEIEPHDDEADADDGDTLDA